MENLPEQKKHIEDCTFLDDKFNRKDFADQLNKLIKSSDEFKENESFTIAIDASWGMGKTQFIHMWKSELNCGTAPFTCRTVYYNAWEHDDYTDAFLPLVSNICKEYQQDTEKLKNIKKRAWQLFKAGLCVTAKGVGNIFPIVGSLEYAAEKITDVLAESKVSDFFQEYIEREEAKKDFRDAVLILRGTNEKLIIFIDELDRCRPTFAIETLEVVKHFFNVEDVVFVFALDMQQLAKAIATVYGQNMDSCGYLSRFFDVTLQLDRLTAAQIISSTIPDAFPKDVASVKLLNSIITAFGLSVRELKMLLRICYRFRASTMNLEERDQGCCFFFSLLVLKYKKPELYDALIEGRESEFKASGFLNVGGVGNYFDFAMQLTTLDYIDAKKKLTNTWNTTQSNNLSVKVSTFLLQDIITSKEENSRFGRILHKRMEMFSQEVNRRMHI